MKTMNEIYRRILATDWKYNPNSAKNGHFLASPSTYLRLEMWWKISGRIEIRNRLVVFIATLVKHIQLERKEMQIFRISHRKVFALNPLPEGNVCFPSPLYSQVKIN